MLELLGISLCSYTGMQSKGEHSMNLCFSLPKKGASKNRLILFIYVFIFGYEVGWWGWGEWKGEGHRNY